MPSTATAVREAKPSFATRSQVAATRFVSRHSYRWRLGCILLKMTAILVLAGGWDYYRNVRVLYGSVLVKKADGSTGFVETPVAKFIKWRPDKVTVEYDVLGSTIREEKGFSPTDVFISLISVVKLAEGVSSLELKFSGRSYVNTKPIPPRDKSSAGLPPGAPRSVVRNSSVELDTLFGEQCGGQCGAVRLLESGTAYAKPIDCSFSPLPPGVDCQAKVGPMMYDGMSVFLAASQDISSSVKLGIDSDRASTYNFSVTLDAHQLQAVVGWAQGDDAAETRHRIEPLMSASAAEAALAQQAAMANEFMSTKVPQLNITLENELVASAEASWDVHPGHVCGGITNYEFIGHVPTVEACQANCSADPRCVEFEYASGNDEGKRWCDLYNTTGPPRPNPKYTCGCRGTCPSVPAPPPRPGPPPPPGPAPPRPPVVKRGVLDSYYYGWSQFWALRLDSRRPPFETVAHAQSAPNNFLGLHLHDTQFYLDAGAWITEELHADYAHGNLLMWHNALKSKMLSTSSYWRAQLAKGVLPDNMGAGWVASSTCDQLVNLVEGGWHIYAKDGNKTFLSLAYDLFREVLTRAADGNISATRSPATGKRMTALIALPKMAKALGKDDDARDWTQLLQATAPQFSKQWGVHGQCWGGTSKAAVNSIGQFASALAPEPYMKDEWAATAAERWLLNSEYGMFPPNASWGSVPLASPLNDTHPGPWLSHTTGAAEAMEGLFRHNAGHAAINLTLEHINAMQRDFGYTIFPEAWDRAGGPWGDQWYLWGIPVGTLLPLERLVGGTYSKVDDVLTVRDHLPPGWASARVKVPVPRSDEWITITVERQGEDGKRINVQGNTYGTLKLEPWLEGRALKSAAPPGYTEDAGHAAWSFSGLGAKNACTTVVMKHDDVDEVASLAAASTCIVPYDDFLEPTYHVVLTVGGSKIHCADAASLLFLDGVWHWWLGCQGGWHHITSTGDTALVDWSFADPLVVAGQGGDTGSVTVTPSGIYLFLPGCGGLCRRVALDRTLTKWSNSSLAKGTDHHPNNFRDPSRPFQHTDGKWYIVAGAGLNAGERFENRTGPLAFGMMYVADDDTLASWTFVSFLHTGNETRAGVSIDTYECPDVWPLPSSAGEDKVVFAASMCSDTCEPPLCGPKPVSGAWNNHGEELWVGTIDKTTHVLQATKHGVVDYGEYYASKTAAGTNLTSRRVLFGFIEASVNRQGNGTNRWSTSCKSPTGGASKVVEPEALPREVALRSDGTIGFEPVKELQSLRIASTKLSKTATLSCGDTLALGDLGHAVEIRATFTPGAAAASASGASYGLSVLGSASGDEVTRIGVSADSFVVDKRNSTLRNATPPVFKDLMTADRTPATAAQVAVFVDGRVVETFVDAKALTTLVYPQSNASTKLGLFMRCDGSAADDAASVAAEVSAWGLRPIRVGQ